METCTSIATFSDNIQPEFGWKASSQSLGFEFPLECDCPLVEFNLVDSRMKESILSLRGHTEGGDAVLHGSSQAVRANSHKQLFLELQARTCWCEAASIGLYFQLITLSFIPFNVRKIVEMSGRIIIYIYAGKQTCIFCSSSAKRC